MSNFGLKWGLPILVGLALIGGFIGQKVIQKRESTLLCQAVNENRSTLRNLLVSARNKTPKAKLDKRARRFYREQIAKITPLDCGHFNRDSLKRAREKAEGGDAAAKAKAKHPP